MKRTPSEKSNVHVICRVRPTNDKEIQNAGTTCVKLTDQSIEVFHDDGTNTFQFDQIFGPDSEQISVFEYSAAPLISDVLSGYNATIFAYGQTGTGRNTS
jgi:kinesin family protein 3/17